MMKMSDLLPKITHEQLRVMSEFLKTKNEDGTLSSWLDNELSALSSSDSDLYHYIVNRGKQFGRGAAGAPPEAISISLVLEFMVLLTILKEALSNKASLDTFTNYMTKLLKGENLNGLNGLDKK
jgi:hypothetical protein